MASINDLHVVKVGFPLIGGTLFFFITNSYMNDLIDFAVGGG